jgi:hypothetical protein
MRSVARMETISPRSPRFRAAALIILTAVAVPGCFFFKKSPPPPPPSVATPGADAPVPGISREARDALIATLVGNRSKWRGAGVANYRFTLDRICFCPATMRRPTQFEVTGANSRIVFPPTAELDSALMLTLPKRVEDLFEMAERIIRTQAKPTIEYDETYGFPNSITNDPNPNAVDDEVTFGVRDFRALR